ncbi:NADPH:quinone reductase-like Zn-dependent oxidoreductase [Blastococcus colisei]|uniref:NADPH:quinone reductase-like Zn-dependent oxidoreductase n=1 Tax=Blastococcus colisei TaxID=1564162 RepID=A0A543PDA5_9ACTN|nr:NAD(P)-dependent alcohol dehydrogenase [Blastococcus colisei]TQN42065.1 NADPH:quinone reductase-like Zn-dependent oxidoreductase [Blastococcus colisei]
MKAIVRETYGPPEELQWGTADEPVIGDDDVLVQVVAAGVDQGVWHLVTGLPRAIRLAGFGVRKPKNAVPGMDVAGVVTAVGAHVTRFRAGDEVFGIGSSSYAEYAAVPAKNLVAKPANVPFTDAAAVPNSALAALQGLRKGDVQAGQRVLVIGAGGGVGSYAVQLAVAAGADVTGICSTAKTDFVRSLGADDVLDYTREQIIDGGRRYDLILDTGGNRKLRELRRALTSAGTLVIVGAEVGGWRQGIERQLVAMLLNPFIRQNLRSYVSGPNPADLQALADHLAAGTLRAPVDRTFPLAEAGAAIQYMRDGKAKGKVVLTV